MLDLLQHAGLIGATGQTLRPSSTALDWLALPAAAQILALRQVWLLAPELSWRWLPTGRSTTPSDSLWRLLTLQALHKIADLPAAAAVPLAAIVADLNVDSLLARQGVGANLPAVRQALASRSQRLLAFLLGQLLPCLGLVDLLPIDETPCLALTAEGLAWLTPALARRSRWDDPAPALPQELAAPPAELQLLCPDSPAIAVDADLCITVFLCAAPAITFELGHCAELLTPGPPAVYRITRASLHRGLANGYAVDDAAFLLHRASRQGLPAAASAQLSRWQEELLRVTYEPGYKLSFAEPDLLAALRLREPVRQATLPLASGQEAWVSHVQAGRVRSALLRQGYVLAPAGSQAAFSPRSPSMPDAPGFSAPTAPHTLPLAALLALVRTYQALRSQIPGLASLGVDDLAQQLSASLPAPTLAGVERIVASNVALLASYAADSAAPAGAAESAGQSQDAAQRGTQPTPASSSPDLAAAIAAAIAANLPVHVTYVDANARRTSRQVRPLRVETRHGQDYLVAFCELRQDERWFRLDRLLAIAPIDPPH